MFRVPPEDEWVLVELDQLALRNGRSASDEIVHALKRHLLAPPTIMVLTPEMPPAEVEKGTVAKKRGRPRKTAADASPGEGESSSGQRDQDAPGAKPGSRKGRSKKD
jgi:hypothetical protein